MGRLFKKPGDLLSFLDNEEEDEDQLGAEGGAPGAGAGLVATPEDLAQQRALETELFGGGPQPPVAAPPAAKTNQPGYWDGGDKFTWRDGAAGALAAVGDALTTQAGGRAFALPMLTQGRTARAKAQAAIRLAEQTTADLVAQGYSPGQARLMANDPKAVAQALSSHMGAYSLGKGDQRYNNNTVVAERPDTFETPTGDRYNTTADGKTTQIYREESPTYQSVDGVGVFGMDRHRPGVMDQGAADKPVGQLRPYGGDNAAPTAPDLSFTPEAAKMREMFLRMDPANGHAQFENWMRNSRWGDR